MTIMIMMIIIIYQFFFSAILFNSTLFDASFVTPTGNINFEKEESCKKIKENFGNETFSNETISKKDFLNLIKQLPGNKPTVSNDNPVSALKESVSAYY